MRAPTLDLNFVPKWWQENRWKKITDWQWHRMWPGFYWIYNSCFVLRTTLLHLQQRIVCNTSMLSYRSLMTFFRFFKIEETIVHGIRAKLVSIWEQNMLYTKPKPNSLTPKSINYTIFWRNSVRSFRCS